MTEAGHSRSIFLDDNGGAAHVARPDSALHGHTSPSHWRKDLIITSFVRNKAGAIFVTSYGFMKVNGGEVPYTAVPTYSRHSDCIGSRGPCGRHRPVLVAPDAEERSARGLGAPPGATTLHHPVLSGNLRNYISKKGHWLYGFLFIIFWELSSMIFLSHSLYQEVLRDGRANNYTDGAPLTNDTTIVFFGTSVPLSSLSIASIHASYGALLRSLFSVHFYKWVLHIVFIHAECRRPPDSIEGGRVGFLFCIPWPLIAMMLLAETLFFVLLFLPRYARNPPFIGIDGEGVDGQLLDECCELLRCPPMSTVPRSLMLEQSQQQGDEVRGMPNRTIDPLSHVPEGGISPVRHPFYCRFCRCIRPLRAKHCHDCGRCVAHYDHHCGWLSLCIGGGNHALFLALCFVGTPAATGYMILLLTQLSPDAIFSIFLFLLPTLFVLFFLTMITINQLFHIIQDYSAADYIDSGYACMNGATPYSQLKELRDRYLNFQALIQLKLYRHRRMGMIPTASSDSAAVSILPNRGHGSGCTMREATEADDVPLKAFSGEPGNEHKAGNPKGPSLPASEDPYSLRYAIRRSCEDVRRTLRSIATGLQLTRAGRQMAQSVNRGYELVEEIRRLEHRLRDQEGFDSRFLSCKK